MGRLELHEAIALGLQDHALGPVLDHKLALAMVWKLDRIAADNGSMRVEDLRKPGEVLKEPR
jgi:hypothetical protein